MSENNLSVPRLKGTRIISQRVSISGNGIRWPHDSKPAFNFKPVVFPNEWRLGTDEPPRVSPKAEAYRAYFQSLIDELRTKHRFTGAQVGQPQSWYSFSFGVRGLVFSNSFAQGGKMRAEMYIDFGDKDRNKKFFDRMFAEKAEIEKGYAASLTWERTDDKRASRIAVFPKH